MQVSITQIGSTQVGIIQTGPTQVGSTQVGTNQVGSTQVGSKLGGCAPLHGIDDILVDYPGEGYMEGFTQVGSTQVGSKQTNDRRVFVYQVGLMEELQYITFTPIVQVRKHS